MALDSLLMVFRGVNNPERRGYLSQSPVVVYHAVTIGTKTRDAFATAPRVAERLILSLSRFACRRAAADSAAQKVQQTGGGFVRKPQAGHKDGDNGKTQQNSNV